MSDDEDVAPRTFVGSLPITTSVKQAASKIRDALGVLDEDELRRAAARPDQLFGEVRRRVEALGVFVLLLGDLGNYKTAVSSSVFRGFALADEIAPVIVINDQDAKTAWTFTLVHELVHLFIGSTGVSGAPTTVEPHTPTARVQRF